MSTATREDQERAVPNQLRSDVRVLGDVLGDVLVGFGGQTLLDDVSRLRELMITVYTAPPAQAEPAAREAEALVSGFSLARAEEVARAFAVYFHLVNVAEEHHRIRALRHAGSTPPPAVTAEPAPGGAHGQQGRDSGGTVADDAEIAEPDMDVSSGGIGAVVRAAAYRHGRAHAQGLLAGLEIRPVLTAHPTEARRRSVVAAVRRISDLMWHVGDERDSAAQQFEARRRLREEVELLWRTAQVRKERPGPLDEVRSAMAAFDQVIFESVPMIYRRAENELAPSASGNEPPRIPAFLRFGSWIGGDRDGNPNVTAAITRQTLSIQSEHVLLGLENACGRIGRSIIADAESTPPSPGVRRMLDEADAAYPDLMNALTTRSVEEPHRIAMLLLQARVRGTRERDADLGYASASEFRSDLVEIQRSLASSGATRIAFGELQHLIWQVETFGFHLAGLEVRQHSSVHRRALEQIRKGEELSAETEEVLATLRVIGQLQQRFGADACRRYVVSFTQSPQDVGAVYELAKIALGSRSVVLDVVPLFETGDDLDRCIDILDEVVALPAVRRRLSATGRNYEVMLGYSDSAKDIGPLSATLALNRAQAQLAAWASRHAIRLTLFHGRGGALGRGGGPVNDAVLAQPAGSVAGRFKMTEQGEVIFARYGDQELATQHLEQLATSVLIASGPESEHRTTAASEQYADLAAALDEAARQEYRDLVTSPGFAAWFAKATPLEELSALPLGSRPARRGLTVDSLADLRAIPWVFAWAQARANVPGWFGVGRALETVGDVDLLRAALRDWPLFSVMIDNAEMSLAKSDKWILQRYLTIGGRPDLTERVLDEHDRTTDWVLRVTGQERMLERRHDLSRAVTLRAPYIGALSFLQIRALQALRDGARRPEDEIVLLRKVLLLTVNGVAAGLQNTG